MPRFTVKAIVSVEVDVSIVADSASSARARFGGHLCMTASLIDLPDSDWDVAEESISEIDGVLIERED